MLGAGLTFLTPPGALAALAALVVVAALVAADRRSARVARTLGLRPASRRALLPPAALATAACLCAGAAAAQPVLRTPRHQSIRSRSEILYVIDVSRSMAAAASLNAPTRLARARDVVRRIHAATADVPSGLAGMTDRVLPYLFPTPDGSVFGATLRSSVGLEEPPPQETSIRATTFGSLTALPGAGYFDKRADWRTCVLVTDGESRSYAPQAVASALRAVRCRLVVVRVGGSGEHVYGADGVPEAGYVPDPAAAAKVAQLAEATGGRAFGSSQVTAAADAVRAAAERGPTTGASTRASAYALAPWLGAAAAVLALAFVTLRLFGDRFAAKRSRRMIAPMTTGASA